MDESEFENLLTEWRALNSKRATSVQEWEQTMGELASEEQRLRSAGRWVHGREDMFGVLGIERAEVRHSAILGWLLDPCARHGLGTAFLGRVLHRAFPEAVFGHLPSARPAFEVTRGDCRADIVVWMNDATVVFENKVDAEESPQQCDILYERFSDNIGARFVFLTPNGRKPASATGEAADAFASVSFVDLRTALEDSIKEVGVTAPTFGRRVAEDYMVTLKREFR